MNLRACSKALFFVSTLAIAASLLAGSAPPVASVTLSWDASTSPDVAGYRVYYGAQSQSYTNFVEVGGTTVTIPGLLTNHTYFFAASTLDSNGLESELSEEISYTVAQSLPEISGPNHLKQVKLVGKGEPGVRYNLEASSDLEVWTPIMSVTSDVNGRLQFVDAAVSTYSQRFYRWVKASVAAR